MEVSRNAFDFSTQEHPGRFVLERRAAAKGTENQIVDESRGGGSFPINLEIVSLSLKDSSQVPPGGAFTYEQPETKIVLSASSWPSLLDKVRRHRIASQLPITGDFESEVQNGVCQRLCDAGFPDWCVDATHAFVPHDRRVPFSLANAIQGTLTISGWVFADGKRLVDQAEADRRAAICAVCEFNVDHASACGECHSELNRVESVVVQLVGRCTTPSHPKLKACWHCGCFNKAQVWLPLESLQRFFSEEKNSLLPEHCWKKSR